MIKHFVPARWLRTARIGLVALLAVSLSASCQSTALPKYKAAQPICIGLMPPKLTTPIKSDLGTATEWQEQIKRQLEQCNVGTRVIALNPADSKGPSEEDCDIIVQPTVQVSKVGELSNNSGAIVANFAWALTYFGYFLFSDMTLETAGTLEFQVEGYSRKPTLSQKEPVPLPQISLSFGERDHVFSSRFFMGLLLLPALQPSVCNLVGIDPADQAELNLEIRERMSGALSAEIARFVAVQLVERQDQAKLPYLISSSLRVVRSGNGFRLSGDVHSSAIDAPSAWVQIRDSQGKEYPSPEVRSTEAENAGARPKTRKYEFELAQLPDDVHVVRLILDDPKSGQVAYTISRQRLLELAQSAR